jgi:hypothetical protein
MEPETAMDLPDALRAKIRRQLCDVVMSPDPDSTYQHLCKEINRECEALGLSAREAREDVALEWRLVGKVMEE